MLDKAIPCPHCGKIPCDLLADAFAELEREARSPKDAKHLEHPDNKETRWIRTMCDKSTGRVMIAEHMGDGFICQDCVDLYEQEMARRVGGRPVR